MDDENEKVVVSQILLDYQKILNEIADLHRAVQRGATLFYRTAQHRPSQQSPTRLSEAVPQSIQTTPPTLERLEPAPLLCQQVESEGPSKAISDDPGRNDCETCNKKKYW